MKNGKIIQPQKQYVGCHAVAHTYLLDTWQRAREAEKEACLGCEESLVSSLSNFAVQLHSCVQVATESGPVRVSILIPDQVSIL